MNALPQSDIPNNPSDSARLPLTAVSWWLDPRVMNLVEVTAAWLALSISQPPRLFDESWYPNTLGVSRESSDHDRLLVTGMFSKRDENPESMALVFASIHETKKLVDNMFH